MVVGKVVVVVVLVAVVVLVDRSISGSSCSISRCDISGSSSGSSKCVICITDKNHFTSSHSGTILQANI